MRRLLRPIQKIIARAKVERDLHDELKAHLELRTDDLVARGLSRKQAARQARVEFGGLERYKELCRDERGLLPLRRLGGGLSSDTAFALRRLRASPLFTIFAVLTLALGIAVTTAVYAALYRAFWRPLGVQQEETLVTLGQNGGRQRRLELNDLIDLRNGQQSVESVEASGTFRAALAAGGRGIIVTGEAVTGGYFNALRPRVLFGRTLQAFDDAPQAGAAAVISEHTWRAALGADPRVIGRVIRIADRPFEVVGVVDGAFGGIVGMPQPDTSVWIALSWSGAVSTVYRDRLHDGRRGRSTLLQPFGRLRPGVSIDAASFDFGRIGEALDTSHPIVIATQGQNTKWPRHWETRPLAIRLNDLDFEMARLILLVPALVLLVACTNLTNLVLSRGTSRTHEFAVRRALGATRWRLVREQLVETGFLAAVGAALGLVTARALLRYADSLITGTYGFLPRFRLDAPLEPAIFIAVAGAALLALAVGGLAPALQLTRTAANRRIAVDSPGSAPPRWRGRSNLIALQVCASVGLFLFASVLIRQLSASPAAESGMELDRSALVSVMFSSHQRSPEEVRRITDRVLQIARSTPGIDVAAAGAVWNHGRRSAFVQTAATNGRMRPDWVSIVSATGGLFDTLGLPLVSGRTFDARDETGRLVVIINNSLAEMTFGTIHASGRELQYHVVSDMGRTPADGLQSAHVIGVVADTYSRQGVAEPVVYMPLARRDEPDIEFLARSNTLNAAALAMALRTAVTRVDPELAVSFAGPADVISRHTSRRVLAMVTTVAVSLAAFALILSMAGLYGVLTHVIGQRTREFGIRAALGADRGRIRALVLKEGLRPVLEGSVIGIGAAAIMTLAAQPMFSKSVPAVSIDYALMALLPLALAGAAACYVPARRASRQDPSVSLRHH